MLTEQRATRRSTTLRRTDRSHNPSVTGSSPVRPTKHLPGSAGHHGRYTAASWGIRGAEAARVVLAPLAIAAALLAMIQLTPTSETLRSSSTTVKIVHELKIIDPATVAAVGDSFTTLVYLGVPRAELSWLNHLDDRVKYVGGYSESGMRTDQIATNTVAWDADVLVIMAGTNDTRQGQSPAASIVYLDIIAERAGIDRVIVSAIGPAADFPGVALAYNEAIAAHASAMGWTFVDPWTASRAADGTWVEGTSYDGIHPTGETQETTGAILSQAIADLARVKLLS